MPIITPTYPHLNSTFNVTSSTLKLIQDKMARAHRLCKRIFDGEESWVTLFKVGKKRGIGAPGHRRFSDRPGLSLLFQTNHIFHEYDHFLVVIATANNYIQWFGLIESKIRHFLSNIEKECYQYLQAARCVCTSSSMYAWLGGFGISVVYSPLLGL